MVRILVACLILASCAPAGMLATGPVHRVQVEGMAYSVQKMPGTENGWAASPADLTGGLVDPEDYARNIAAIERHTGCRARPETVANRGMLTTVAVRC